MYGLKRDKLENVLRIYNYKSKKEIELGVEIDRVLLEKMLIAQTVCEPAGINVEQVAFDIHEIQGEDPETIVTEKAGTDNLKILPETIFNGLINLQQLWTSNNKLSSLPKSIGNLISLTTLDISRNDLCNIPKSIEKLTSLRILYLDKNKISKLPERLRKLTSY